MNVYLVRHAQAVGRSAWPDDDDLRPLSAKGERQARGLVDVLGGEPIVRVLSSPSIRCMETVRPLARSRKLKVESEPALLEGAPLAKSFRFLTSVTHADGDVVLCSHGDVIPDLLSTLRARGVEMVDEFRWSKGSTWVLAFDGKQFTKARYLPPPR